MTFIIGQYFYEKYKVEYIIGVEMWDDEKCYRTFVALEKSHDLYDENKVSEDKLGTNMLSIFLKGNKTVDVKYK